MGDTANIASRLQGLALPNSVALSAATARLLHDDFTLEELGAHNLKGVAEPVLVFRVVDVVDSHEDDSFASAPPFLVGRDEEIGLLQRRWQQAREGLGKVVLINGEAGIGKSSLVETLRAQAQAEGFTRVAYRSSPYHANSALYPIIEHVQRALAFDRGDTPEAKLTKLQQIIAAESTETYLTTALHLLAAAYGHIGQPAMGIGLVDKTLALVEGRFLNAPELYCLKGELLLQLDSGSKATATTPETCFQQALDLVSYWDSLIWATAKRHGTPNVLSEDFGDGRLH